MAKSRNPLKDLSNLTEMPIVKNWIVQLRVKADRAKAKAKATNMVSFLNGSWTHWSESERESKRDWKEIGRIVWMPISQPTPKAKAKATLLSLSLGLL